MLDFLLKAGFMSPAEQLSKLSWGPEIVSWQVLISERRTLQQRYARLGIGT